MKETHRIRVTGLPDDGPGSPSSTIRSRWWRSSRLRTEHTAIFWITTPDKLIHIHSIFTHRTYIGAYADMLRNPISLRYETVSCSFKPHWLDSYLGIPFTDFHTHWRLSDRICPWSRVPKDAKESDIHILHAWNPLWICDWIAVCRVVWNQYVRQGIRFEEYPIFSCLEHGDYMFQLGNDGFGNC